MYDEILTKSYRLVYKFSIFSIDPPARNNYYIDARSGEIVKIVSLEREDNAPGTADTKYSGTRPITTDLFQSGSYRLQESRQTTAGNSANIRVYNSQKTSNYTNTDFIDQDNNWTSSEYNNANKDNAALDALWDFETILDFWSASPRLRNSWNDLGGTLIANVHYGSSWDNAMWSGERIAFGDGSIYKPFSALDVAAHEFGHAVMDASYPPNGMTYSGQSGAIDEGLSDLWAACVEQYANDHFLNLNKNPWIMGENIETRTGHVGLRSLSYPNQESCPDTYGGTYWHSLSDPTDNYGVHTNCGILDYWAYLIANGGSGGNDLGHTFTVYGINVNNLSRIIYSAETGNYLNINETYNDLRTATETVTENLYGVNSLEVRQVRNAWYAVGVGNIEPQTYISKNNGSTYFCANSQIIFTLNNLPAGISSILWTKDSGFTAVSGNNGTSYTVSVNSTAQGYNKVYAAITSSQGTTINLEMSQWLGKPSLTSIIGPYSGNVGITSTFYASPNDPNMGASYTWTLNPLLNNHITPHGYYADYSWYSSGSYQIISSAANGCGSTVYWRGIGISGGSKSLSIFPNPASDEITVTLKEQEVLATDSINGTHFENSAIVDNNLNIKPLIYNVSIIDYLGNTYYNSIKYDNSFVIPITTLRNGNYILRVADGNNLYSLPIIVKH